MPYDAGMSEPKLPQRALRTVELPTWSEFLNFTASIAEGISPQTGSYAFRGQADSDWKLEPSLTRLARASGLDTQTTIGIEATAREHFSAVAYLHLPSSMIPSHDNLPVWWSLMQHYGAPTRLLDWTHSPFVAAYFACESHIDRPGAIWIVHGHSVNTFMEQRLTFAEALRSGAFREEYPPRVVYLTDHLTRVTDRMLAQQMSFSVTAEVLADHEALMREAFGDPAKYTANAVVFMVALIPADKKLDFLFRLRAMNITAQSLFPGIDGLGRSVSELVRLSTHRTLRHRSRSSSLQQMGPLQFPTAVPGGAEETGQHVGWYLGVECRNCGVPILEERGDALPRLGSLPSYAARRDIVCPACKVRWFYEVGTVPHLFQVQRMRHGRIRWAYPPDPPRNSESRLGCTCEGCPRCDTRHDRVSSSTIQLCRRLSETSTERCRPCSDVHSC